jgi:glutamine amidotransferase
MQTLSDLGLDAAVREFAARERPLLGLCLGMQLLLDESDEFGPVRGLGLIGGRVVAIPAETVAGEPQKIPHIGWSALRPTREGGWAGTLLEDIAPGEAAYFVHAFMAELKDPRQRLADCNYGGHSVTAAIQLGTIAGCQFHPEKSGEAGLKILRRFLRY